MAEDRGWAAVVLPVALLALVGGILVFGDPGGWLDRDAPPPASELAVEETQLEQGTIRLEVTNEGPEPVHIAQVLVDEAYWQHTVEPDRTIEPLGTATVEIPYHWVEGEPVEIAMVTSVGETIHHEVDAATETRGLTASSLWTYTLIGLFVGVLPVAAGVGFQPILERAPDAFRTGLLAFTVGLLAFLGVDSLAEGLELAEQAPAPLGGPGLILVGVVAALAILQLVSSRFQSGSSDQPPLTTAYLIATAIGLHNLGEGLVIGAAYAVGEIALGTFLIVGFTLHNVTEGPAIVSPLDEHVSLRHLAGLAAVGGLPTIAGAWIGASAFTPFLGAVFFAIGVGAILQVVLDVGRQLATRLEAGWASGPVAVGSLLGVLAMWGTGLLT